MLVKISIFLILSCLVYETIDFQIHNDKEFLYPLLFIGILYNVLAALFLVVGILMIFRVKRYFKDFYDENKKNLIFVSIMLSSSLLFRGIFDTLRYFNSSFHNLVTNHDIIVDAILFFFCDMIPCFFQLSTMIFGYIRQKN